jgi:trans-aconitate methyltransferase
MSAQAEFLQQLETALAGQTLSKLTLSKPRRKSDELRNIYGRLVELKGGVQLSCTFRYATRDETHNYPLPQAAAALAPYLNDHFRQGDLFTADTHYTLLCNKKGEGRLQHRAVTSRSVQVSSHDRQKQQVLPDLADRSYLQALGITTAAGKVRKDGRRKFRQINKYLELIGHLLEEHPLPSPAHIVDMGSGKGYLTFALYDYLRHHRELDVSITGIELRPQLVADTNALARAEGFDQLQFVAQDIHDYQPTQGIDMLIALHACDTATDEALAKGIRAGAELIVVAPCCHKQVRQAMATPGSLAPMLRHGILLERQAEMLTDAIRALLLEAHGYRIKVFEFISTEHTPKNVMITATKATPRSEALTEVDSLKQQFGLSHHHLEELLS